MKKKCNKSTFYSSKHNHYNFFYILKKVFMIRLLFLNYEKFNGDLFSTLSTVHVKHINFELVSTVY